MANIPSPNSLNMVDFVTGVSNFRKANKGKCMSTTHTIDIQLLKDNLFTLCQLYPNMDIEIKKGKQPTIRIPMGL